MRERLTEIVGDALSECLKHMKEKNLATVSSDFIIDRLLENGVIAPPCKIGDSVFRIVEMSTGITSKIRVMRKRQIQQGTIHPVEPTIKRFIRCVIVTKNNFFDVCDNFGKTVFHTKEEAEQALRKDEGK